MRGTGTSETTAGFPQVQERTHKVSPLWCGTCCSYQLLILVTIFITAIWWKIPFFRFVGHFTCLLSSYFDLIAQFLFLWDVFLCTHICKEYKSLLSVIDREIIHDASMVTRSCSNLQPPYVQPQEYIPSFVTPSETQALPR